MLPSVSTVIALGMPTGPETIIIFFAIVGVVFSRIARAGGVSVAGPALVLKEFQISPASADGIRVRILGRPAGFIAWVLSLAGLTADTALIITDNMVELSASSLSGKFHHVAPITGITSTHCGYSKNIWMLFLIAGLVVSAFFMILNNAPSQLVILPILGCIILAAAYVYSRRLMIAVQTAGGTVLGVRFQRGVIEGVPVNFDRAAEAIDLINQLIAVRPTA